MQTIFEEINQKKPFEVIENEVYLNLLRTSFALREKMDETMRVYGVDHFQYNILRILRGAKSSVPFDEIISRMVIKSPSENEDLSKLAERGLIKITEKPAVENIAVFAEITNQGLDILEFLDEPIKQTLQRQLGFLGKDLLEQFNALLVMARKNTNDKS